MRIILTFYLLLCSQAFSAPAAKPNILVILADTMPDKVAEMQALLEKIITDGRSTLGATQKTTSK